MKNDITKKLISVINALNNTSVSGKQNLTNIMGSISVLEDVIASLQREDVTVNLIEKADNPVNS